MQFGQAWRDYNVLGTYTPVSEPTMAALLGVGAAVMVRRGVRRERLLTRAAGQDHPLHGRNFLATE
jgi:hypothetical protein